MKDVKRIIPVITVFLFLFSCKNVDSDRTESKAKELNYNWLKTDTTFALLKDEKVVWQLNYSKKQDKPFFSPLRVNGHDLTLERPTDHPWHRGLWFSWRFINKINYWEEDPESGLSEGRSKIRGVNIVPGQDYSATISIDMEYAPEGGEKVLKEQRTLHISPPNDMGNYIIDWKLDFIAGDSLLVFSTTPPLKHGGVVWGGYAGLGYRGAETLEDPVFTTSTGWKYKRNYTGEAEDANWMDLSANLDTGTNAKGGITIFDHPDNPRHPSPWYIWFEADEHIFFTPAILYNGPLELAPNDSIQLKYRVFVHSGSSNIKSFNKMYSEFENNEIKKIPNKSQ